YRNRSQLDKVRLLLTGVSAGTSRSFYYDKLHFLLRDEKNDFLPRLWATRRVGWLMEQVRTNGESKELRDEIVDLGTGYGIVTPYTSYLALEADQPQPVTSLPRNSRPGFVGRAGSGNANAPAPKVGAVSETVTVRSGAEAVAQSKQARDQQDSTIVGKD